MWEIQKGMDIDVPFNWRAETELCTIMQSVGSPIAGPRHSYTKLYDAIFGPVRQTPLRILQFGLAPNADVSGEVAQAAATLRGWRTYFPNATVFGADPDASNCIDIDGAKAYVYNWQDTSGIITLFEKEGMQEKFDIIVYSGPGNSSDKVVQFEQLVHALKVGGVLILETIHWRESIFWSMVLQNWQRLYSNIKYRPLSVLYPANREDNIVIMAQVVNSETPIVHRRLPLVSDMESGYLASKQAGAPANEVQGEE
jgi:hypothetical protein